MNWYPMVTVVWGVNTATPSRCRGTAMMPTVKGRLEGEGLGVTLGVMELVGLGLGLGLGATQDRAMGVETSHMVPVSMSYNWNREPGSVTVQVPLRSPTTKVSTAGSTLTSRDTYTKQPSVPKTVISREKSRYRSSS